MTITIIIIMMMMMMMMTVVVVTMMVAVMIIITTIMIATKHRPGRGDPSGAPQPRRRRGDRGAAESARAYLFPQSVKIHYFCGPISVDPTCPKPVDSR